MSLAPAMPLVGGGFTLAGAFSGVGFLEAFNLFTGPDPTNGFVKYLGDEEATQQGLVQVDNNGTVYLRTDHVNVTPEGRPSVRMESALGWNSGLFLTDIQHMPENTCGTWPALWMLGQGETWPKAGEIDIIEGVNDQVGNTQALHVDRPYQVDSTSAQMTGEFESIDCDINAPGQPNNKGCAVTDSRNSSYGKGFNAQGGGVSAVLVSDEAVSMWLFERDQVPHDITTGQPNPSYWGLPVAEFKRTAKDIASRFRKLKFIINTTFCGDWAGKDWTKSECSKLAPTCQEYVAQNPQAFQETYWAVNSLKVYQKADTVSPPPPGSLQGGQQAAGMPVGASAGQSSKTVLLPPVQASSTHANKTVLLPPVQATGTPASKTVLLPPIQATSVPASKTVLLPPVQITSPPASKTVLLPPIQATSVPARETVLLPPVQATSAPAKKRLLPPIQATASTQARTASPFPPLRPHGTAAPTQSSDAIKTGNFKGTAKSQPSTTGFTRFPSVQARHNGTHDEAPVPQTTGIPENDVRPHGPPWPINGTARPFGRPHNGNNRFPGGKRWSNGSHPMDNGRHPSSGRHGPPRGPRGGNATDTRPRPGHPHGPRRSTQTTDDASPTTTVPAW